MKHHYICCIRLRVDEDEKIHRFVDSIIYFSDDMVKKEMSDQLIRNILTESELKELVEEQSFSPSNSLSNIGVQIHFMKVRAKCNGNMTMHLFHAPEYVDEDTMCTLIKNLDIKEIKESKIRI